MTISIFSCRFFHKTSLVYSLILASLFYSINANAVVTGLCGVVYVTTAGNSSGTGTPASPVDLATALNNVQSANTIRIQGGTYNYSPASTMSVPANCTIDGGYDATWLKNSGQTTTLNITAPVNNISGTGQAFGFSFAGNNIVLQDLTISVTRASGTYNNYGVTVYAVYSGSTTGWQINRCVITAGAGGNGNNGTAGGAGNGGAGGGGGEGGYGTGGSGTAGGYNGNANHTHDCGAYGNSGTGGGNGNSGGGTQAGTTAGGGNTNGGGGGGGNSITGGYNNWFGCCNWNAVNGNGGGTGNTGGNATETWGATHAAAPAAGQYFIPVQAASGAGGGGGSGGGGGGSGADGTHCGGCSTNGNWSGGGGGTGGNGGAGGTGGYGAGGSFGVYAYNSTGTINYSTVNAGTAGTGGAGGAGASGSGGSNGSNGQGASGSCNPLPNGAGGGKGGSGGSGAQGEYGANGISVAIEQVSSTVTVNNAGAAPDPTTVTINYGASTTSTRTEGCTNSEIVIAKSGGTFTSWTLPAGASLENDETPSVSSYTNTSASINVCFNATTLSGNLQTGAGAANTYEGFVKIAGTNSLPTISTPSNGSSICSGGSANLTTSDNGMTAYNWAVDQTNCDAPFYSSTSQSPGSVSFTTLGTWYVRLREQSSCCGWSCPSWVTFTVVTGPTITTQPQPEIVCSTTGTTALSFVVTGGVGTWTYQWYSNSVNSTVGASPLSGTNSATYTPPSTVGTIYYFCIATESGSGCGPLTSNVVSVEVDAPPTTATVSPSTQTPCGLTSAALGGNTPSVGTGTWTQFSGPGTSTFSSVNSGSSTATATVAGTYVYKWTIANGGCGSTSASTTVTYSAIPTTATVGATQNLCGTFVSTSLGGNTPAVGTGAWSQVSGPSSATFSNSASGSSTATVTAYGAYVFKWTITNGTCNNSASITVNYYATPTTATTTLAQNICGSLSATLGGNTPVIGSGLWSLASGPGISSFTSPTSGTSTVNVSVPGTYIFTWTITNGTCTSAANDTVSFYATPTTSTVGSTQNICGSLTSTSLGGNTPSAGTGTWSQTSGPGTSTFSSVNSGTSTATATIPGTYVYAWTISNGNCTPSSASLTVNYYATPTTATVGSTQNICGSLTTASLGGNTPSVGTGLWTQTAGPGTTTFSNSTSGSSTATASVPGAYQYTWTISNGTCTPSAASVTVNYYATPTTATGIGTQNICGSLVIASLGGDAPTVGTGLWTIVSGPGTTTFGNATSATSSATVSVQGTYIYKWTISNGTCTPSTANDTINFYNTPTTATVGATQNLCGSLTTASLGGNTPTNGTGLWTQTSGPGTTTFSSNTSGSSTATASVVGTYVYTWTISNGTCTPSAASMTINYYAVPTIATAGAAQNICNSLTSGALGGNTPTVGTGIWTQLSGPGFSSFGNANSGTTTASVSVPGSYVFVWTISNGTCPPTSANDTVNYYATPTTATVGTTQNICGSLTSGSLGGNTPTVGTGLWTQTSGPGTTTFSSATSGSSTATASQTGSYVYTWTISNGSCTPSSASVTVDYIATPSGGSIANTSYCAKVGSGSVSVTGVSNATQYTWALPAGLSGSSTTSTIAIGGNQPGSYTVTVTPLDIAYGTTCTGTPITGTVQILAQPVIDSVNLGSLSCYGGSNDTITVYATSTNGNLTYSINNGTTYPYTSGIIPNLSGGFYAIWVKDDSSCATGYNLNPVQVLSPPQILLSIAGFENVKCNGDSTGYVNIQASGGTGQLTFLWNNGATSEDIADLATGNYTVTAKDANGCTSSISQFISQPTHLTDTIISTNITCFNANNATADFVVNGGTPPYTYLWSNGDTSSAISNLSGAVYSVTAKDNNGCIAVSSVNIINPQPVAISLAVTNVSCYGAGNGGIVATVTGGTPSVNGYVYTWTPNVSSGPVVANATPGTYILLASDSNGCTATDSAKVTQPLTGLSATSIVKPIGCAGDSSGSIEILASGGVGGYTYTWASGQSIQVISGLQAGTYTCTITDANGCEATVTAVLQTPATLFSGIEATNVTCNGASNGTLDLTVSGGVPPYNVLWTNDDTSYYIAGVGPGQYGVVITDAYGCKQIDTITVTQPSALSATVTVTNVDCRGANTGSVVVTVTGGTPGVAGYTYSWSPVQSSTDSVSGVGAGTYTVVVTDSNSCTITASGAVTQPLSNIIVAQQITPVKCNSDSNGAIALTVNGGTGGYIYNWSSGQSTPTISGLPGGIYNLSVTDAAGCVSTLSDTLINPAKITDTIISTNVHPCFGDHNGTATITVSGGVAPISVLWSTSDTSFAINRLAAGTYTVTITDANGCQSGDTIKITRPTRLKDSITVSNVLCFGSNIDTITVVATGSYASGGYTYTWSPNVGNTPVITGVAPGTYIVTVTDTAGCKVIDTAVVSQPASPLSISAVVSNVTCNNANNGSITVSATGGTGSYTYKWTTGQTTATISGLSGGPYTVTVTDGNGCTMSLTETVINPAAITSSIVGANVTCAGAKNGSATLTVNGGTSPYTFFWSDFETTQNISNLAGGTYRVIITDSNGCHHNDSVVISEPLPLSATVSVTNIGCNGGNTGKVIVTVTGGTPGVGGYIYNWSPVPSSTDSVIGLAAGTYNVTVTDSNSCTITDSGTVTQQASTLAAISLVNDMTCHNANNGSIDVLASGGSGGYTYSWTGTAQTTADISGLSAGTYSVTVKDANGCTASLTDTIHNPSAITSHVAGTNVTCAGANNGSATLTVSGGTPGYTFLWSNFETTQNLTNIVGGTYRVIITDSNGCHHEDSVVITEPAALSATVRVSNVLCFGANNGSVVVTVTGGTPAVAGYTYAWSPVPSSTDSVSGVGPGTYTVTVKDSNQCSITASGTVSQPLSALSVLSNVVNVSCGGNSNGSISLSVNGGTPSYTFTWATGQHTQNITGLAAGIYTVTVADVNGCSVIVNDTVKAPVPITSSIVGTNVTCAGANNGTATLTVSGGSLPYTFLWSNFSGAQNQDSLSGGWHYVIITDGYGCQHRDSVKILEPLPLTLTDSVSAITCANSNNGGIFVAATGGTGAYSYVWSPSGPNSPNNTNLGAGTYTVTVSDINRCSASISASLTNPTVLTLSDIVAEPKCNGELNGGITLYALGGTPQYTYTWSPAGPNSPSNTNIGAGVYAVTVSDAHGCQVTSSITVGQPAGMYVSGIQKNVSCYGLNDGAIYPTPYGGTPTYSFQWYLGTDTFAPLGPSTEDINQLSGGNYYLIITDANGCKVSFARDILSPDSLTITPAINSISCAGSNSGSVAVAVTGGTAPYQYLWNNFTTDSSQVGITAGTYTVIVTDSNGCHKNEAITVTQTTPISIIAGPKDLACANDSSGAILVVASGGVPPYSYAWNTLPVQTTSTISGLAPGIYIVVVTDSLGCSKGDTFNLTSPPALVANTAVSNPTCAGGDNGFVSLDVRGGSPPYIYDWSTLPKQIGNVASALTAGTYYDTITDMRGCILIDSAIVVSPPPIVVGIDGASATCAGLAGGGVVVVNASGGLAPYTFGLGTAIQSSDTFTNLTVGNYTIAVTDANGCVGTNSVTIGSLGSFTDTLVATPSVVVAGQTVQLYANAVSDTTITSYIWYPSDSLNFSGCQSAGDCDSPTAIPMITQTYTVTVVNARGCSVTSTVKVTVNTTSSVFVPSAFTPNGDGLNDFFAFDILGATTVDVHIWNRWGELVYSNAAQPNGMATTNAWDGTFNGKRAEYDTYTYQFVVTYYDGHTQNMAGTITLLR